MAKHCGRVRRITWKIEPDTVTCRPNITKLIFCVGANRPKLQFRTFKKAYDYIKWNSSEILEESGKAPNRAYWCSKCGCFHVTSRRELRNQEDHNRNKIMKVIEKAITEKSIEKSKEYLEFAKKLIDTLDQKELLDTLNLAKDEIKRREFDSIVHKVEYLFRISNWSEAEKQIQILESFGLNEPKVIRLRNYLENKI